MGGRTNGRPGNLGGIGVIAVLSRPDRSSGRGRERVHVLTRFWKHLGSRGWCPIALRSGRGLLPAFRRRLTRPLSVIATLAGIERHYTRFGTRSELHSAFGTTGFGCVGGTVGGGSEGKSVVIHLGRIECVEDGPAFSLRSRSEQVASGTGTVAFRRVVIAGVGEFKPRLARCLDGDEGLMRTDGDDDGKFTERDSPHGCGPGVGGKMRP